MARSLLILCVVLAALVHTNVALLGNSVGTHLQATISKTVDTAANDVKALANAAITKVNGIADDLKLTEVTQLVKSLQGALPPLLSQVTGVATETVSSAVDAIPNVLGGLQGAVESVVSSLVQLLSGLLNAVGSLLGAVGEILNLVGDILPGLIKSLNDTLGGLVNQLSPIVSGLVSGLDGAIKSALDTVSNSLDTTLEFLDVNLLAKVGELRIEVLVALAPVYSLIGNIENLLLIAVKGVLTKVVSLVALIEGTLSKIVNNLLATLTETLQTISSCTSCINGIVSVGRRRRSYVRY